MALKSERLRAAAAGRFRDERGRFLPPQLVIIQGHVRPFAEEREGDEYDKVTIEIMTLKLPSVTEAEELLGKEFEGVGWGVTSIQRV